VESVKANACLIERKTFRSRVDRGKKRLGSAGLSELVLTVWKGYHSSDKRYTRDNRLIAL